jgi:hypothetical protein
VNVVDADFAQVACSVEGSSIGTSTDPKFQADVDLHGFPDGPITTSCTAMDLAGNSTTQAATVTLRRWTETLRPRVLRLAATSGRVTMLVEGPDLGLLLPIEAHALALLVPGGGQVPADATGSGDSDDGSGRQLTLKFDRGLLAAALRSGIAAGAIDPTRPVTIQLVSGTRPIGSDQIRLMVERDRG